jgi:hypothetical protein
LEKEMVVTGLGNVWGMGASFAPRRLYASAGRFLTVIVVDNLKGRAILKLPV